MASSHDCHFPGCPPIDAYGEGGFRFADMSHRGSLLFLPSGVHGWDVADGDAFVGAHFTRVLAQKAVLEFLILGTGQRQIFPASAVRALFLEAGLGLEVMDTGSAARTYNILLAEKRAVGAALIAVA